MTIRITALHGMLGEPSDWDFLRYALGSECEIETPDLFQERWQVDLSEIGTLINSNADGDILLGYSMGGRLALHALIENPNCWRAAIIVSAHPGLDPNDRPARRVADHTWSKKARSEDWTTFVEYWNGQPIFSGFETHPDRAQLKVNREAIATAFGRWSLGRQENLLLQFPNIHTPILWITGGQDAKFTALAQLACEILPSARHSMIPASGHRPHLENTSAFLATIRNFLDAIPEK